MELLEYRAGPQALEILRQRGLTASDLDALVLPAIGPKWLVLAGFDRALLEHSWFDAAQGRALLFGSSVGAWRALALASRDPRRTHAALVDAYCRQRFTRADAPPAISNAYRRLIREVYSDDDLAYALRHPRFDVALAAVRARGPFSSRAAQASTLASAALLNALSARTRELFFERVIFDSRASTACDSSGTRRDRDGTRAPLTADNVRDVALASGTVPMYMQAIQNIAHAPVGTYLDGGFSDYHVNQRLNSGAGICMLFLHQRRIVPGWLDKFVPWRRSAPDHVSRLLLIYPNAEFVRSLPGGAVPTRDDFQLFVDRPDERIARWREVVARSEALGESFLRTVASGEIAARTRAL
jgi:hypothetical protein